MTTPRIGIIGGGLAGSEAALQLAKLGIPVRLYDMKPHKRSPAHHSENLAEIVCSNSFGSQGMATASGLLKEELALWDCQLLAIAKSIAVPAGKALAVDRDQFAQAVTDAVSASPLIEFIPEEVSELPGDLDYILIATGPLTTSALSQSVSSLVGREQLYFFDAASPIIAKDSINFDIAFIQDRYQLEKNETPENISEDSIGSYINCPLDKAQYEALVEKILGSEKTPLKEFEKENPETENPEKKNKTSFFESCLPVEVIASRGHDTLRFGPMKPVGLMDPRTNQRPYAVVQLRQDNLEGTLYNIVGFQTNIKWGEQGEMIRMIPGLENAEVVRFGVMHRNTYLHSPEVLLPTLQLKKHPHIFIAGQLTGTEGYTESIACGLIAARNIARLVNNQSVITLPRETMLGALLHYITREEAIGKSFQPINSNWGILPPLQKRERNKLTRNALLGEKAIAGLREFLKELTAPEETPAVGAALPSG